MEQLNFFRLLPTCMSHQERLSLPHASSWRDAHLAAGKIFSYMKRVIRRLIVTRFSNQAECIRFSLSHISRMHTRGPLYFRAESAYKENKLSLIWQT